MVAVAFGVGGAVVALLLVFPTLNRMEARARDGVPADWTVTDDFRDAGLLALGRRAEVTLTSTGSATTGPGPVLASVCPGVSAESLPGGGSIICRTLTMDVTGLLDSQDPATLTTTVYRRGTWWLITLLAASVSGIAGYVITTGVRSR